MRNLLKLIFIIYILSTITVLLSCCYIDSSENDPAKKEPMSVHTISIYRTKSGTISTVPFETYVTCVVACEVPGSFHMEALKAQAVAARTYAYAKVLTSRDSGCPKAHPLAPVCDSTHCQVYKEASILKEKTGWSKISDAVSATKSQLLYYDGELVMHALFHSSSGGRTENSEDVFVSAVPYLQSVSSPYEDNYERNGHGVGMSQHGANGMAESGYSYTEILTHYYQGTEIH